IVAAYPFGTIPAFASQQWFVLADGTLTATSYAGTYPIWTFRGDGALTSNPIVVGNEVVVGSGKGNLYVLSANSSAPRVDARVSLGVAIPPSNEITSSAPWTGLGFGDGLLVVPAGTQLFAF